MQTNFRKLLTAAMLLFVLAFSAVMTMPVSADEPAPQTPTAEETADVPEQDAAEEEAVQTQTEPAPASEESQPAETVETILEAIPQDTELIVVDEAGETLPLVTEEAAEAIIVGDPIWCPVGVTPNAGAGGCSPNFPVFGSVLGDPNNELLAWMAANDKKVAGVIWIAYNYASGPEPTVNDNVTINGLDLTEFSTVALTLQGGWNGFNGSKALNPTTPYSTFNASLSILNWNAPVTISDINVSGNASGVYSMRIVTTGNITVTRVNVSDNFVGGASFENNVGAGTGNITVSDSTFNNNVSGSGGLRVLSNGAVTMNNVTANGNGEGAGGTGIDINNQSAATAKAVTLSNITASGNRLSGLFVQSKGAITVTDITAVGNGQGGFSNGVALWNDVVGYASPVTMNGTNLIFSTTGYGLHIKSNGAVKLNSVHAVNNTWYGAYIKNDTAVTPQPVTLTGTSTFKFNGFRGLEILTLGQITLNNVTASSNNSAGAYLVNKNGPATNGVTLTGTNLFSSNNTDGLYIESAGAVTINNITANDNGVGTFQGLYIDNSFGSLFKGVTLTGIYNTFIGNKGVGLWIKSDGIVTLNNITANANGGGVIINNRTSTPAKPMAVNIVGTNMFNDNKGNGLGIQSHGAVTLNNITANFNGIVNSNGYGLSIDNATFTTTPANVTLNGINTFNGNYHGGLLVYSLGIIKANSLTVKDNLNDNGATFGNNFGAATAGITLTGTNIFTGNKGQNLTIYSFGVISLNNITASNSVNGHGALIDNSNAVTPKAVILTGINTFSGNWFTGLNLSSKGAITLNNVTASNNGASGTGGFGASLHNNVGSTAGVTLAGNNAFNNNYQSGLQITTFGTIKANNVTANNSIQTSSYGAFLDNSSGTGSVMLTGTNAFSGNNYTNLYIYSAGVITLSNVTANNSVNGQGAYISNLPSGAISPKAVTLTGKNTFNGNHTEGLEIYSYGAITTNNLIANGNGLGSNDMGVRLDNSGGTIPMPIKMNAMNTFVENYGMNLAVYSLGAITANNVTANNSVNHNGATLQNDLADVAVNITLTGINSFSGNAIGGLSISSKGTITVSNITANNNVSGTGAYLSNSATGETVTNKPIMVLGYIITNNNGSTGLHIESYSAIALNNVTSNDNNFWGVRIGQVLVNAITPVNVTVNGVNQANGNVNTGMFITTLGNVTISNLTASENGFNGMRISATDANAIGNVTLKGTNVFNGNATTGLVIFTNGTVLANNVTVRNTLNAGIIGAQIINTYLAMPKAVTFTGVNTFSSNNGTGLSISTLGAITISNLTANDNSTFGAELTNNAADTPANVTLSGTNQFSGNGNSGLLVTSKGVITVNNLTASGNGGYGAFLDNTNGTAAVNVTGANFFNGNVNRGLYIQSNGAVTLTKITADGNGAAGLYVTANGSVNLTCGSFTNNASFGLYVNLSSPFIATLKGIVSAGNIGGDTNFPGTGTVVQTRGCPLP